MDGMEGMAGMGAAPDPHAGHNHSAHADHGAVGRTADGVYFYTHGAFTGHVVPGAFFLVWGLWWAVTTLSHYTHCLAAKKAFTTRAWRLIPFGPQRLRQLPLEPFVKIVLPLAGILGELWLGHESFRTLYQPNGMFLVDNLNDWQHSTMYLSFMTSGIIDLLGHYLGAPPGTELAFLCLSFLSEGVLLVFHLKGPTIEIMVHLILVLQIFATVFAILGEMAMPHSIVAAALRPWLTMLQGVWWIHTAFIMYTGAPQWDPEYMGSGMFVPVPFVLHMLWLAAFMFLLLLVIKAIAERRAGRALLFEGQEAPHSHEHARLPTDEAAEGFGSIELGGLMPHKPYSHGA